MLLALISSMFVGDTLHSNHHQKKKNQILLAKFTYELVIFVFINCWIYKFRIQYYFQFSFKANCTSYIVSYEIYGCVYGWGNDQDDKIEWGHDDVSGDATKADECDTTVGGNDDHQYEDQGDRIFTQVMKRVRRTIRMRMSRTQMKTKKMNTRIRSYPF